MKYTRNLILITMTILFAIACGSSDSEVDEPAVADDEVEAVAQQQPGSTFVPPIGCEVTEGPNKGKKGERSGDGWCEGDWGGTECKPRSKCNDLPAEASGSGTLAGHVLEVEGTDEVDAGPNFGNPIVGIVPAFGSPAHEYCLRTDNTLSIVFANTGSSAAAGGNQVTVTFDTDPETDVSHPMPAIPVGGVVDMSYEIPGQCFNADCEFSVTWTNQPATLGRCIG